MEILIISGLSGAGKSRAAICLEDGGYYIVDNLPAEMMVKFAEFCEAAGGRYDRLAFVYDVRAGEPFQRLTEAVDEIRAKGLRCRLLFLEADTKTIINRYKETRRSHPLARDGRLAEGIRREREALSFLKKQSDYIIDTSALLTRELRSEMEKIFVDSREFRNIFVTVLSFGFKNGIPADADLVFDVRFLPNPYYVENLKQKTGLDPEVQEYVMGYDVAHAFLAKLEDMVEFLLPNYVAEGKNQLVIAIGCTGGHHRSVTLAEQLYVYLKGHEEYGLRIEHRDIRR